MAALALVLLGCGAVPSRSVTIVPPVPVITAGPSVAPSPSASALPDAAAAAEAVRAFAMVIRDPALSYGVTAILVERYAKGPVKTTFTASVSGADYRGSAKAHGRTVGFAYVDDQGWAKVKGTWFHLGIQQAQADDAVRPWETLCWLNDLSYTGRPKAPADGFTFTCPAGYEFQNRRLRSVGAHGRIDALALVVDAAGTPVTLHVEGEDTSLAGEAIRFTLDVRFKDVGKPVTIKAP